MSMAQHIKLDPETLDRLKALGEVRQRSQDWLMHKAISDFLDREEAVEREKQEDLARWQAYETSGHAIDHQTASNWLKSLASGHPAERPK